MILMQLLYYTIWEYIYSVIPEMLPLSVFIFLLFLMSYENCMKNREY